MRLTIDEKAVPGIQETTGKRKRSPAVREAPERPLCEREKRELPDQILPPRG